MNVLFKSQTGHSKDIHCAKADFLSASPFSEPTDNLML